MSFHSPQNWRMIQFDYPNRLWSVVLHCHWIERCVVRQIRRTVGIHRWDYHSHRIDSIWPKMRVLLHRIRCRSWYFVQKPPMVVRNRVHSLRVYRSIGREWIAFEFHNKPIQLNRCLMLLGWLVWSVLRARPIHLWLNQYNGHCEIWNWSSMQHFDSSNRSDRIDWKNKKNECQKRGHGVKKWSIRDKKLRRSYIGNLYSWSLFMLLSTTIK